MPDNKYKPGNPDKNRVNIEEKYELNEWSQKFGVSPEELKKVVKKVGTDAGDVEAFLRKSRKPA